MQIVVLFGVLSIPTFASADGGLLGSVLNQPEEIVETVTEEVANTTSQVEDVLPIEADQIEPIPAVTNVVESVNNSTKKVTATVASEKPILEVNISEAPAIKVNTNVVETEISNTPKVKVDTPIVKVEVADTVEVDTEEESEPEIAVQTPVVKVESPAPLETTTEKEVIETPNVDVEIAEPPAESVKQGTNPIQENKKVKPQSSRTLEIGEVQDEVVIEKERNDFVAAVEPKSIPLPMKEPTNFEQVKVTPTFQSGPSTQQNSGATTGVATVAMLNGIDMTTQSGALAYLRKTRLFFDQWLNAPPSQPPQHSLFMISGI